MIDSNIFDRLIDFIYLIDSKHESNFNLLFCGDMNARTSDKPDFVVDDNFQNVQFLPG
jgi:hypothetical protein